MLKKILILISLIFIITSCGNNEEVKKINNKSAEVSCENSFKIGKIDKTNIKLKGVIVSDETKNISSPIPGTVRYLNCEAGKKVSNKTLIAKVTPDFNNPNIINLNIQKGSLINQRSNLYSVKTSTNSSFDSQIDSIKKQIKSTKEQIGLLENNIKLTKKSNSLNKNDLNSQISSLETNLNNLNKNLLSVKKSRQDSLDKIIIGKKSLYTNIKSITKDNLYKIDEIYGITFENKRLNDRYEDYLGIKNSVLKNEVKKIFLELNNIKLEKLSDIEISNFLEKLIILDEKAQLSVKESVANIQFSQVEIDAFYKVFLNYGNSISEIKNNWDSLDNSNNSINTNFDNQITGIEGQIKTTEINLKNLQTNKIDSTNLSLDLQLSGFDSQLKTLKTNISNLESQKINLQSNKKSQILNLDNQVLQLNQNIASLNSSLSSRNIYAGVYGIIKQKVSSKGNTVGAGMAMCKIIPNAKSTKIKIYSPVELNLGDKLTFDFKAKLYEIKIENALVYKDVATGNYVYESNYLDRKYFKDGEIISLDFESDNLKDIKSDNENKIKNIPVSYIKNKIDGNYVKILSGSLLVDKKVELGDINGNMVEVEKGIEGVVQICK